MSNESPSIEPDRQDWKISHMAFFPNSEREEAARRVIESYENKLADQRIDFNDVLSLIDQERTKTADWQLVVIKELMAADPKIKSEVERRTQLAVNLLGCLDEEVLNCDLNAYLEGDISINQRFVAEVTACLADIEKNATERRQQLIAQIRLALARRAYPKAKTLISQLADNLRSSKSQLEDLVSVQECPTELIKNVDQIVLDIEVRNLLLIIDQLPGYSAEELILLRTKVFSPILKEKFSNSLLLELIEGRYDLTDPTLGGNMVAAFLPIRELVKEKKKLTPKQKIIAGVTSVLIAASLWAYSQRATRIEDLSTQKESVTVSAEDKSATGTESQTTETESVGLPDFMDAITPENSERVSTAEIWQIKGKIPTENFVLQSSSFFEHNQWLFDSQLSPIFVSNQLVNSESMIRSNFFLQNRGQQVVIPVPEGYLIQYLNLNNSETKFEANYSDYQVYSNVDGSYILALNNNLEQSVTIDVGFQPAPEKSSRSNAQILATANNPEFLDTETLINIEIMDADTKAFLDKLKLDRSLSVKNKADRIVDYIKNHFVYSLNKEYSDYYLQGEANGEYVSRAWKVGYGDCDVVNTVTVAFLRYAGISAKLDVGYANNSSLLNKTRNSLDQSEMHGWASFFNPTTDQWEDADATPTAIDPDSADELERLNGGEGIGELANIKSLKDLIRSLSLEISMITDFSSEWGLVAEIASLISTYLFLFFRAKSLRAKNNRIVNEVLMPSEEIDGQRRAKTDYESLVIELIQGILSSKTHYAINHTVSWVEQVLVLPHLIKIWQDWRVIFPVSEKLKEVGPLSFFNHQVEPVKNFLARATGLADDQLKEYFDREELRNRSRDIYINLLNWFYSKFDHSIGEFSSNSKIISIENVGLIQIFRQSSDEREFITKIFHRFYLLYLSTLKFESRKRASHRTMVNNSHRENGSLIIGYTDQPLPEIEFVGEIAGAIPILLEFYAIKREQQRKKYPL